MSPLPLKLPVEVALGGDVVEAPVLFEGTVDGAEGALTAADGQAAAIRLTPQEVKSKIFGTAQPTGNTVAHQWQSYREAILLARNPEVEAVYLNQGYNAGLELAPKTISPNLRPDVLGRYLDGRVARVEVQSATDFRQNLIDRNVALDPQIIKQGYTPLYPRVVLPRGQ